MSISDNFPFLDYLNSCPMSVDFQWAKSIREICKLIMNTCLVTIITNKRLFITQRQGIEKMFMLECIHWTIINGFSHTMNSVCRVSIFLCKKFWHWNFVAPKMHLMDVKLYMLIECVIALKYVEIIKREFVIP